MAIPSLGAAILGAIIVCSLVAPPSGASRMMFDHQGYYGELDYSGSVSLGRSSESDPLDPHGDPHQVTLMLDEIRVLGPNRDILQSYSFAATGGASGGNGADDQSSRGSRVTSTTTMATTRIMLQLDSGDEDIRYQGVRMRSRKMSASLLGLGAEFSLAVHIFSEPGVINEGTELQAEVDNGHVLVTLTLEREGDECPMCEGEGNKLQILAKARGPGPIRQEAPPKKSKPGMEDGGDDEDVGDMDYNDPSVKGLSMGGNTSILIPLKGLLDNYATDADDVSITEKEVEADIMIDFPMFTDSLELGTIIILGTNEQLSTAADQEQDDEEYGYDDDEEEEAYDEEDEYDDDDEVEDDDNDVNEGDNDVMSYTTSPNNAMEGLPAWENTAEHMKGSNADGAASSVRFNMAAVAALCLLAVLNTPAFL